MKTSYRNLLLAASMALAAFSAFALQDLPIALVARPTGTTVLGIDQYAGKGETGVTAVTHTTSITATPTVVLTIQGKSAQGDYYDIISSAATAVTSTSVLTLKVGPGLPATANVSANEFLPPVFRVKAVVAGSSASATFSVSTSRHGSN